MKHLERIHNLVCSLLLINIVLKHSNTLHEFHRDPLDPKHRNHPTWLPFRQLRLIYATLNHSSVPHTLLGLILPNCARDQGSNPCDIYSAALEAEAGATKQTSLPIIVTTSEPSENQQPDSRFPVSSTKLLQNPTGPSSAPWDSRFPPTRCISLSCRNACVCVLAENQTGGGEITAG